MDSEDPDRAAILARRQGLILLALTGLGVASTTGCSRSEPYVTDRKPQPCLTPLWPGERRWVPDPVTTVCPAELEQPVSLLKGSQIRLPLGLTPEALDQPTPDFVGLRVPVESVSCVEDVPGALIEWFAMTSFPDDPSKSMPALRDELLAALDYRDSTFSEEVIDEAGRSYEVVIDVAPAPTLESWLDQHEGVAPTSPPEARAFLRLKANAGRIYAVVYEVHPDAWNAMAATLRASAESLSFSSP